LSGTVVISLLTLGCSTIFCALGIYAVADQGRTVHIGPAAAVPMILLGIMVWIVPPLLWSAVVEENEEEPDET
jgi:hypothetical protein